MLFFIDGQHALFGQSDKLAKGHSDKFLDLEYYTDLF